MDKQAIRERVWDHLDEAGIARFPFPPHGRIPNFDGADGAAARFRETGAWAGATTLKCNPDAPQLPVRRAALRDGKTVYVAVPRLAEPEPFLELDPDAVEDVDGATTVSGVAEHGRPVDPEELPRIDLVVAGSVAVTEDGARVGKGEGYSDLEWALLGEFGAVDADTVTATTVHGAQVVENAPVDDHDVPLDLVVTPERTVRTDTPYRRPDGVDWDAIDPERVAEIPVLERLRP